MACGFASLLVACSDRVPELPTPRGVILVSLDTLRADHLGAYGYDRETSPAFDRLAARSIVFEQASSQAPWTLPAHAALFASRYPSVLGLGKYPDAGWIPPGARLLTEVLKEAGFRTQAETAGGFVSGGLGFARGFDAYHDRPRDLQQNLDRATTWLAELGPDDRFFLFVHTYDIHRYDPPDWAREALVEASDVPSDLVAGLRATRLGERGVAELVQNPDHAAIVAKLSPATRVYLSQVYDAAILATDRQLGRLVEELEALGLFDETLLIVTSDHGEELFDRGNSGHGYTLFEENLHVPLLVHHPSLSARRIAAPVRTIDLAPTVLAFLGLPVPDAWQGRSLLPAIFGAAEPVVAFAEGAHRPYRSARDDRYKLIRAEDSGREQLFDLDADPYERRDLAGTGLAQERRLREALDAWRSQSISARLEAVGSPELDADLSRQLEALGYLDADAP